MNPSAPLGAPELHAAVAAEAEAAEQLLDALCGLRRRAETRDPDGLEPALERARRASECVARAGSERMRCTAALARSLGLDGESTLGQVAERAGRGLAVAAAGLRERLLGVARESAALGICSRFGAASCERLQSLQRATFGLHAGYGADGRLGGNLQGHGRHA